MSLNLQTFKTRALTAAVFVLVMLAGLLWNELTFFLLFSVIHFGCWAEYQKLAGQIDPDYRQISPFHQYGVMIAGWCLLLFCTNDSYRVFGIRLHELGWWLGLIFIFAMPIVEILFARQIQLKNIGYSALGLVYISLSLALLISLRSIKDVWATDQGQLFRLGFMIPLAIIFSIWINDTMAYIVGSMIGKTALSKISPKKTWEGTVGGMLLCVVVMALVAYFLRLSWADAAIIALIAAVFGTLGDLLESKLKRMAGVKDSGQILPGHGGFLDRFDSLLIAVPFVWLYVMLVLR
ncbi:MAG TPA: phosphatidate cytidylyltransferase [Chitinophagaceae bacterium]|jgi:phosphatidate cytidylyltransferase|nr:phosphatidate cytidylyltransferase [Chitinophagaceae bacterium]